jgi:hypothetical protein
MAGKSPLVRAAGTTGHRRKLDDPFLDRVDCPARGTCLVVKGIKALEDPRQAGKANPSLE